MEIILAILGGGGASTLMNYLFGKRGRRLDEARIAAEISRELREELSEKAEKQTETIGLLRSVIISLTGLLDEIFPRIEGITPEERNRLRDANLEARLTALRA
ncbi:hypothetical protein PXH78_27025 [Mycolicibacterium smegmatis]|uniref:hypothetical protein n=1 Tax=Mycolicibacterium smegmatis TaxID=1772 RepID=UPI0005D80AC6|nr:hypothetical protein [Mycolicibacterium smegmatis]MDF1902766.1 hypothetical protein [Mycolicibacterium smegmatis]MDF1909042.1 hypothetical protein [Mycolicibacterium smegmatis]MDF1921261.1 hypothetical protein [Mycolicibacterium smegmatis]MDF1927526.1 hypothetical protein [Mycolicibacterium smegmatis]UAK53381.1 hypothetical protein K8P01_22585 [Mycolicibacterium smegmatis]